MKVTLLDYTGACCQPDYAIDLLIFTKNTRLQMSAVGIQEIAEWPKEKKMKELEYMANTIPSSWEFVHYTFMIEGVTRAFTHQFVRSRQCSFAQQTMRVLDVSEGPGWDYLTGPTIKKDAALHGNYQSTMGMIARAYRWLVRDGAAIEDARGILPTNILTNIAMSCNMRTFVELVRKRSSSRTQGEYREVLEQMKSSVRAVHPWIDLFIERDFDRAANDLDKMVRGWKIEGRVSADDATHIIKLIDQMRGQS